MMKKKKWSMKGKLSKFSLGSDKSTSKSPSKSSSSSSSTSSTTTASSRPASTATPKAVQEVERYVSRNFKLPAPFDQPDNEANLLFEDELHKNLPVVRGGTMYKLVERVTFDKFPDPVYTQAFLLTYRSFTTPTELLELLKQRFNVPDDPGGLSGTALDSYRTKVQRSIRLRVYNLCKSWVSKHWYDFADPELKSKFERLVHETMKPHISGAVHLVTILEREMAKGDPAARFDKQASGNLSNSSSSSSDSQTAGAPKSIVPHIRARALVLLDFHPTEFARQLTIIEFGLYTKIKPWEFLGLAWAKKGAEEKAPHILDMIQWTNRVTSFTATEILRAKGAKGKIATINFFIKVIKKLNELNNFSGIKAISAGFQHAAVHRLRPYWGEIPKTKIAALEEITNIVSSEKNFKNLRPHLKQCSPPLIPYMGMYLTDLTFIDEGNKDLIPGTELINFGKRRHISSVISDIQQYQQTPYVLAPLVVIQEYIKNTQTYDDDTLYKVSEQTIARGDNKLSLKELQSKRKGTPASSQAATDAQIAELLEEAEQNFNYGELEAIDGYPFYDSDQPGVNIDLKTDSTGQEAVIAGTIAKLVERLTHPKRHSPQFMESFLLTWPTFMSSKDLLAYLNYRFNVPQPVKANLDLKTKFKKNVEQPIQLRVCNVMKIWVDKFFLEFLGHPELAHGAIDLMKMISEVNPILRRTADRLIENLQMLASGEVPSGKITTSGKAPIPLHWDSEGTGSAGSSSAMPDRRSTASGVSALVSFHPKEFARQLALLAHDSFMSIKPSMFLAFIDGKPQPPIQKLLAVPQLLSTWVAIELLSCPDVESRVSRLAQILVVADESMELRNYNALAGIVNGLQSSHVNKLEVTWKQLDPKHMELFEKVRNQVASHCRSFSKFQKLLKTEGTSSPCTPPLHLYTAALKAAWEKPMHPEGNSNLISFARSSALSTPLAELLRCQRYAYALTAVPAIRNYVNGIDTLIAGPEELDQSLEAIQSQESLKLLEEAAAKDEAAQLNKHIRQLLLFDDSLKTELRSILDSNSDLSQSAEQQHAEFVSSFKRDMAAQLQGMTAKIVIGSDDFEDRVNQVISERFADLDSDIDQWQGNDSQGLVYGWPDEIVVDTIADATGHVWILHPQPNLNEACLATLIRKRDFYLERNAGTTEASVLAIVHHAPPHLHNIASSHHVEIAMVENNK